MNGVVDDVLFYASTTGSGLHRLPFALHLYNQTTRTRPSTAIYGRSADGSETVGIQSEQQLSASEWTCPTSTAPVTSGLRLTFVPS